MLRKVIIATALSLVVGGAAQAGTVSISGTLNTLVDFGTGPTSTEEYVVDLIASFNDDFDPVVAGAPTSTAQLLQSPITGGIFVPGSVVAGTEIFNTFSAFFSFQPQFGQVTRTGINGNNVPNTNTSIQLSFLTDGQGASTGLGLASFLLGGVSGDADSFDVTGTERGSYLNEEVRVLIEDRTFGTDGYRMNCATSTVGCGMDDFTISHLTMNGDTWTRISFSGLF